MPEYKDDSQLEQRRKAREEDENKQLKISEDAKAFLIARTKEYVKVPIVCNSDVQAIEIRARLTKSETKKFKNMFDLWEAAINGDPSVLDGHDDTIAEFLDYITKDDALNYDFWMSSDIDEDIVRGVLITYFIQPAANLARVWKFRHG